MSTSLLGAAFCVVRKREAAASCGFPAARLGAVRCAQGNDLLSQGALRVCHIPSSHRICCPLRAIAPLGAAPMRAFLPVASKIPYAMAAEKHIIMRAPHSPHAAPSVAQDPHPGQTIPPKSRSFLHWIDDAFPVACLQRTLHQQCEKCGRRLPYAASLSSASVLLTLCRMGFHCGL